jgi:glycosyltransferase involved in cell wall biosynthesis
MENSPLIPEVGIIALVADDWGQEWMSRHQILTRLARYFQVVWVNPSPEWRHSLRMPLREDGQMPALHSGFQVYRAEFWLPKFYKPRSLAAYISRKRLDHARNLLLQKGCKKVILYIWRPEFTEYLDHFKPDLSCYHIVDEYSFSDVDLPTSPQERELLQRVDQIFVHTKALLEKKCPLSSHVKLIPNGVAYESFASPLSEPAALRPIPHPRIGYAGYLKKTLDWNLLAQLSAKLPDLSFVFVGTQKNDDVTVRAVQELSRRPNIHFLGHVTTAQMPFFPQHFDVCMMPYVLNDYTSYVYPLKLHEYLASGRPVVASPTRLLKEFQGTILIANGVDEWSAAIVEALSPPNNTAEARDARQAVARKHDWELLVRSIVQVFCERLDLNRPELLEILGTSATLRKTLPILTSCP